MTSGTKISRTFHFDMYSRARTCFNCTRGIHPDFQNAKCSKSTQSRMVTGMNAATSTGIRAMVGTVPSVPLEAPTIGHDRSLTQSG